MRSMYKRLKVQHNLFKNATVKRKPIKKRYKILELEKGRRWTNVHRLSMLRLELDVRC